MTLGILELRSFIAGLFAGLTVACFLAAILSERS